MPFNTGEYLGIQFGIAETSTARLVDLKHRFARFDGFLRLETEAQVAWLAKELEKAIEREFKAGTDKLGESHDKSGYTLSTLHVEILGMTARITMGGGAVFIQYGVRPHVIRASTAPELAFWWKAEGVWFKGPVVHHPGITADDFIGRAIRDIEFAKVLSALFSEWNVRQLAVGDYTWPSAYSRKVA